MPTYAKNTTVDAGASRAEIVGEAVDGHIEEIIETGAVTLALPGRAPLLLTG